MEITQIFGFIGEKIAEMSAWVIKKLAELGINVLPSQTKLLNLLVISLLLYLFISVIQIPKKPLKVAIIILLIILGASTIISML